MQSRIDEIDAICAKYSVIEQALQDIRVKLYEERKTLVSKMVQNIFTDLTPKSLMAFRRWDEIDYATYTKLANWMDKEYSDKGVGKDGRWPDSGQMALRVQMNQNLPFDKQLGLMDFWPYIEPTTMYGNTDNKPPLICIHIFEHTLSQHCSYYMRATPDKKKVWVQKHYDFMDKLWTGDNPEGALKYIYNRLPYIQKGER